ncbi:MAG: HEAT repeat domain-containing protein [Gemmatimonadaceae bacterium]
MSDSEENAALSMDYSVTFARHFARLVWLLLNESGNIEQQKASLRALATVAASSPAVLAVRDWQLIADDSLVPDALPGVQELTAQLIGHGIQAVSFALSASPADLLGIARILASQPSPGEEGETARRRLADLGTQAVQLITLRGSATPADKQALPVDKLRPAGNTDVTESEAEPPRDGAVSRGDAPRSATPQPARGSAAALLSQLGATGASGTAARILDELAFLAEGAARDGHQDGALAAFHGIVAGERELAAGKHDIARAYVTAIRRMSRPTLLRSIASQLPRRRGDADAAGVRSQILAVLRRAGEDGAEAVIELIGAAQSMSERRVYYDVLLELDAGVPSLIHTLGDARWHAARNAADLLGEMRATEADSALGELLRHDDERVRRAAATALAKLATGRAAAALHLALVDSAPAVRMQGAVGLGIAGGEGDVNELVAALETERDGDVQSAILGALGRIGTAGAVHALVAASESDGRFFRRKPMEYRLAAVRALGDARTPAAIAALRALANDRDKGVRERALDALMKGQLPENA